MHGSISPAVAVASRTKVVFSSKHKHNSRCMYVNVVDGASRRANTVQYQELTGSLQQPSVTSSPPWVQGCISRVPRAVVSTVRVSIGMVWVSGDIKATERAAPAQSYWSWDSGGQIERAFQLNSSGTF